MYAIITSEQYKNDTPTYVTEFADEKRVAEVLRREMFEDEKIKMPEVFESIRITSGMSDGELTITYTIVKV
jgi:hypothetical protein